MRMREAFSALSCAVGGLLLAYVVWFVSDNWPGPVMAYSVAIVGLGGALVVVHYSRLGPFGGEFGSPGVEAEIRQRIAAEVDRARRYGRDLTIVAVRHHPSGTVEWSRVTRATDALVKCRKDTVLLVLPETSREGALTLLSRLGPETSAAQHVAIVNFPEDARSAEEVAARLVHLARECSGSGKAYSRTGQSISAQTLS